MASVNAAGIPDPDAEGAYTYYQNVNCYLNVYAPTTVFTTTTAKHRRTDIAHSCESGIESPQTPVHPPVATDCDTIRIVEPYTPASRREAVLAWLIARLSGLRERVSR
jgi:hypothetical protein